MGTENDQHEFFRLLLEKSNAAIPLFRNISPQGYQNWVATFGHGTTESGYQYRIRQSDAEVGYFTGSKDLDLAKRRFEFLKTMGHAIEAAFGEPLHWRYKVNHQAQVIASYCKVGGLKDKQKWPEIQKDLVDRMVRLERALRPHMWFPE